ncbi:uncharacterized protein LOC127091084 [Lathyrus oleraceus]|uniref:uncharacterized protein LOC127091084 n=1 Tax=Pisum sativum TaxID=3888 RepID=UPI0021D00682|nr:uncharacterized protein LOC127091084 [Pisum sativum]
MEAIEQHTEDPQQITTQTATTSTTTYKEPQVLDRPPHVNLATPFEKLEVHCESLMYFDNLKRNDIDLTAELEKQGWGNYFQRLHGPVYTFLVKEFWIFADCNDHCIISYVLGVKMVIIEKSIAKLLNMEKTGGKRIYNINPRAKYISQEIVPTIFKQNPEGKTSKNKELHQNLRVWLKIILGTIHHRPTSNSSDYINTDQKCVLYCLHKGLKLNLPSLLFKYLRDSVRDTRNHMKPRNYIPLGRLISDVLMEIGMVDHLIFINMMEDVTVDVGKPLNARNMKSMRVIDRVIVKPTLDTSWDALKDQRKIPHAMYIFSNIDPLEVIAHYLQDLASQGIDISDFTVDWLPEHLPNFTKRMRESSKRKSKKKTLKLGEPSVTKTHVPLDSSVSTSSTYTPSEPTISIPTPYEPHNSEQTLPYPPLQQFNLTITTLPIYEALLINEPISPPSSTPSSPPYYDLSFNADQTDIHDPSSLTLAQLQDTTTSEQALSIPETSEHTPSLSTPPSAPSLTLPTSEPPTKPSETTPIPSDPINPTSESEPTFPTLEDSFALFSESSAVKLRTLSEQFGLSDNPSEVRTHWNGFLIWMTFEVLKLKGLFEQVRNGYLRSAKERLEAPLTKEDEEKACQEVEEKARLEGEEQARKEAEEKVMDEVAAAAEAKAKAKADAE